MSKNCYITTPIYYASGKVHIGNSYSTIACDTFARYHRLKGDNTYFLTGMDEHGQKIENVAKEKGVTPQEFVNDIAKFTKGFDLKLLSMSKNRTNITKPIIMMGPFMMARLE